MARGLTGTLQAVARMKSVRRATLQLNRVLERWGPWSFRLEGETLYATSVDRIAAILMHRFHSAERFEIDLWRALCRPGAVVLDVGSNLGLFAFIAAREVGPAGRVWAFEPDSLNCAMLRRALARSGYDNVEVIAEAVTDHVGSVRFRSREEHRGDSHVVVGDDGGETVGMPATTLDDALGDAPRVDLIKFDIQGAEALAIRGMRRVLAASPDLRVLSEFWPEGLRRCGADPDAYLSRWRDWGFSIAHIDEDRGRLSPRSDADLLALAEKESYVNIFLSRGGSADLVDHARSIHTVME